MQLYGLTSVASGPQRCKVTRTDILARTMIETLDRAVGSTIEVPRVSGLVTFPYVDVHKKRILPIWDIADLDALNVILPVLHVCCDYRIPSMFRITRRHG